MINVLETELIFNQVYWETCGSNKQRRFDI